MKTFTMLLIGWLSMATALSQTSLQGTVTDAENGQPIIFGTVALYKNGVLATGTETDLDGFYSITELDPGKYDLVFSYTGYQELKVEGVEVLAGKANKLDAKIRTGLTLCCGPVCGFFRPLIQLDETTQGIVFDQEELKHLPYRW